MKNKMKRKLKPYTASIISVFIAVLSITLVSIVSMVGTSEINNELDGLGLNGMLISAQNEYDENITNEVVYTAVKSYDEVVEHTPIIYDYAQLEFSNSIKSEAMCWGVSNEGYDIANLELLHGEFLQTYQIANSDFVCVIDESLAIQSFGRSNIVGKEILLSVGSSVHKFKIIGVVKKGSSILNNMADGFIPNFVYIPYTIMQNISFKSNYDQIIVNLSQRQTTESEVIEYIFNNIKHEEPVTIKISNLASQRDTINNIIDIAFWALFFVSSVALIVCSIAVATSVTTAVSMQKKDIGVKLSLGASRTTIMLEFLFASLTACVVGILIGIMIGIIILVYINIATNNSYVFDYTLLISGIFVTIFLTGIFSIYPSYKASILTPVNALNRE